MKKPGTSSPSWYVAIHEACYMVACSYELAHWLTQGWTVPTVDLDPLYDFWKAGGQLSFDEKTCYVWRA